MADRRVIDAHCHLASHDCFPRSFIDGVTRNLEVMFAATGLDIPANKLREQYLAKMQDHDCDELVAEMDAAGIEKAILLIADFTYALEDSSLTIDEIFERHAAVLERHPGRFEVFGGVDPRWGDDGVALFSRAVDDMGFTGFKVYPPCGFSPSDERLFPYYEICASRGFPVVTHQGPTSPALSFEHVHPFLIDRAARNFPGVDFVLAHGSVSFVDECVMMCSFRPNVFMDVSAFQGGPTDIETRDALAHILTRGINHKILFGTDWPVFRAKGTQLEFASLVYGPDGVLSSVPGPHAELVLHKNAERLLAKKTNARPPG